MGFWRQQSLTPSSLGPRVWKPPVGMYSVEDKLQAPTSSILDQKQPRNTRLLNLSFPLALCTLTNSSLQETKIPRQKEFIQINRARKMSRKRTKGQRQSTINTQTSDPVIPLLGICANKHAPCEHKDGRSLQQRFVTVSYIRIV